MVQYVAHNVSILLKQTHRQSQAEDEPSDADSLPRRLINPNQYNSSLLSESEQVHTNSTYVSISKKGGCFNYDDCDDPITSFIGAITTSACYVVLVMHTQLCY